MTCKDCEGKSRVVDVRKFVDGSVVKRRRECLECKRRFTTYEEEYKRKS